MCIYQKHFVLYAASFSYKSLTNRKLYEADSFLIVVLEEVFQTSGPFTDCIREINNTPVDNPTNIDLVMPMYI